MFLSLTWRMWMSLTEQEGQAYTMLRSMAMLRYRICALHTTSTPLVQWNKLYEITIFFCWGPCFITIWKLHNVTVLKWQCAMYILSLNILIDKWTYINWINYFLLVDGTASFNQRSSCKCCWQERKKTYPLGCIYGWVFLLNQETWWPALGSVLLIITYLIYFCENMWNWVFVRGNSLFLIPLSVLW